MSFQRQHGHIDWLNNWMMLRDFAAFLGTSFTCAAYIAGLGWVARHNILDQHLSRKIMHIGEKPTKSTDHMSSHDGLA